MMLLSTCQLRRNKGHFDELWRNMPQSKNHIETVSPLQFPSIFFFFFFLHLMPRYVSLFSSTVSFATFTQWQWISYQLISIYCVSKNKIKNHWELNKFLNIKIVIYKIIISFRLVGLIFFVNAVDCELSLVWFCVFFI